MFSNTIDKKAKYTNADGTEMLDLAESIFGKKVGKGVIISYFKVPKSMEMRPDLVSMSAYGSDAYAEMVMKYSDVRNPFALQAEDIVSVPSLTTVYNDVKDSMSSSASTYPVSKLVQNYHKYRDPTKVEGGTESDKAVTKIPGTESAEANLSATGFAGVTMKNGRLYFGDTSDNSTAEADSAVVDCATDGLTAGQFIAKVTKNSQ